MGVGAMIHIPPEELGPSANWYHCKCMVCNSADGGCKVKVHVVWQFAYGKFCSHCQPSHAQGDAQQSSDRDRHTTTVTEGGENVKHDVPGPVTEKQTMAKPK
jgi:hypothetical protein